MICSNRLYSNQNSHLHRFLSVFRHLNPRYTQEEQSINMPVTFSPKRQNKLLRTHPYRYHSISHLPSKGKFKSCPQSSFKKKKKKNSLLPFFPEATPARRSLLSSTETALIKVKNNLHITKFKVTSLA